MINIYIKELEKEEFFEIIKFPKWTRSFIWKVIKKLNIILKKEIEENRKIYFITNVKRESTYKKIKKKLEKEKIQTQKVQIILAEKLKQYRDNLKEYKILDGKPVFINNIEEILKEVLDKNPIELQDIYILSNKYSQQSIEIINKLILKIKTMNIITNEIQKYKTLEEIMQEKGFSICTANNKRKSLKKAKIIINLNFTKEELNKYTIFRNAMILNINQEKLTNLKGFEGIIIQDIEVELRQAEWIKQSKLLENFRSLEVYESITNFNQKIQVSKLYGNNGQINEKELRNWQKILTN